MRQPTVVLLAHGLSTDLTGIERLVLTYASWWAARAAPLVVTVDEEARWPSSLPPATVVLRMKRRPAQLLRTTPLAALAQAQMVHSFGPPLPRVQVPTVYSVYDWGPFRDRSMPVRARVLWGLAIVRGTSAADVVHAISEQALADRPRWLGRRASWRMVAPTGLSPGRVDGKRDGSVLFVGTDVPRKRLDALVAATTADPSLRLVLAGRGTEGRDDGERVRGLGIVDDAVLEGLFSRCSAVALVSSYEGFGIPVQEALDRGIPVVVSPAVAECHPGRDRTRVVVSPEPQEARRLAAAMRQALALGVIEPVTREEAVSPGELYRGLL